MASTADVGEKIRAAIDELRGKAKDASDEAQDLQGAWEDRDWGWLVEAGVITTRDARRMAADD